MSILTRAGFTPVSRAESVAMKLGHGPATEWAVVLFGRRLAIVSNDQLHSLFDDEQTFMLAACVPTRKAAVGLKSRLLYQLRKKHKAKRLYDRRAVNRSLARLLEAV